MLIVLCIISGLHYVGIFDVCLCLRGWKVVSISGDKQQHARTKALSLFKDGSCPLMVHTVLLLLSLFSLPVKFI